MVHIPSSTTGSGSTSRPSWWVTSAVVLSSVLLTAGAMIGLTNPSILGDRTEWITTNVRIYADYLVARNGVLALVLILLLLGRAGHALVVALLAVGAVQVVDVILDAVQGRVTVIPAAAVIGAACIAAAFRHSSAPLWNASTWRGR